MNKGGRPRSRSVPASSDGRLLAPRWAWGPRTPFCWQLDRHGVVASTQDEAINAARNNHPGRLIVMATEQTQGRGRNARAWASPPGNLYASFLIRPHPQDPIGACWAKLACLAVRDAIGVSYLSIKPPNDILLKRAKLAGMLVDAALTPAATADWVVIGVGVNTHCAPLLRDRRTACLDGRLAPEDLAVRIADYLDTWVIVGWPAIESAYRVAVSRWVPYRDVEVASGPDRHWNRMPLSAGVGEPPCS